MTETLRGFDEHPAADGGQSGTWLEQLPEELRKVALNKGWREPADALKSYRHLEEFLGAEKSGRGIVLPRDDDDHEGYARLYQALGRPDQPEGYGLFEALGEAEIDQAFTGAMSQAMHQAGLSTRQARKVAEAWQQQLEQYTAGEERHYEDEKRAVLNEAPPARLEAAKRGFRLTGVPLEMAERIERSLGPRMAVDMFARIGEALAEDRRIAEAGSVGAASSPEGARRRMDRLMADPAFSRRYLGGDKNALDEISELARRATNR